MHDVVKDYYGKVLTGSEDLQTNACCTDDGLSDSVKQILSNDRPSATHTTLFDLRSMTFNRNVTRFDQLSVLLSSSFYCVGCWIAHSNRFKFNPVVK